MNKVFSSIVVLIFFFSSCKNILTNQPIRNGQILIDEYPIITQEYLNGHFRLWQYRGKLDVEEKVFIDNLLKYKALDSAKIYFKSKIKKKNKDTDFYKVETENYIRDFYYFLSKRDTAYYNIELYDITRVSQFTDDTTIHLLPSWYNTFYPVIGLNYYHANAFCQSIRDWKVFIFNIYNQKRCNWKKKFIDNYNANRNNFWRLPKVEELEEATQAYENSFSKVINPEFPSQYFVQNKDLYNFAVMYYRYRRGRGIGYSEDYTFNLPRIKPPVFITYENFLSEFTNKEGVFWGNNSLDTTEEQRANKIKHLSDTLVPFLATFRCVCEKKDSLPELQYKKGKLTTVPKDAHRR